MAGEKPTSYLVVVGSSAGGIEALSMLVSTLPANFPSSIVIAQHLAPNYPSRLEEILSRYGPLPVKTVVEQEALEPGTIFVVPANRQIKIDDHHVQVMAETEPRPKPSIDRLFSSAAAWFKERLIAVVLSGTGSDGADGARVVHESGGTVIIQNPETAAFPGMPRSLAPATIDLVANLEDIGGLLTQLVSGTLAVAKETPPQTELQVINAILQMLRDHRGVDFQGYRRPTILRRLQRRVLATHSTTLMGYLDYLRSHPEEEEHLVGSFLIKVTDFFRDAKTFDYLRKQVMPDLIEAARNRQEGNGKGLRLWSAGCATGEEAYSLAILVSEVLREMELSDEIDVRIFATDMEDSIVGFARRGVYPRSALKNIPPETIKRYFHEVDGEYEVDADVRSLIVFGPHDLVQMPPFPRMDLVLCRNVLMYFTPELQRRALQAFAFALHTNGYLVLGSAETTRPLERVFVTEQAGLKIFRRTNEPAHIEPSPIGITTTRMPFRRYQETRTAPRLPDNIAQHLTQIGENAPTRIDEPTLLGLPIGIVIVDRDYDIHQINTVARRLLGIHGLAIDKDMIHLLTSDTADTVRAAIDAVFDGEERVRMDEVLIASQPGDGERQYLQFTCAPRRQISSDIDAPATEAVLVVTDVTELSQGRIAAEEATRAAERAREELAEQLARMSESNRRLLRANEELAFAEETLRATRDEYAAVSADAQATTEELETYAEELQATSEELETLNEELRSTVEELTISNDDLDARANELSEQRQVSEQARQQLSVILSSMGDAVVVVDSEGTIVHANGAFQAIAADPKIPYIPRDEQGKPLADNLTPQARAMHGESFTMQFTLDVEDGTRRWYEAIGQPISPHESGQGVVVIRDITDRNLRQAQEEFVARISHELRTPLTALHGYLQLLVRRVEIQAELPLEQVARTARSALDQGQRLETLVSELMDFTRLRGGRMELNLEQADLIALAARTVEVASSVTERQQIVLETDLEELVANVDKERLEGVLYNLLTNAIKYAPEAERIEVRVRKEGDQAAIDVQDYGDGIPEEDHENIFGRFFQGDQPIGTQRSGLGLGLYIAREVVSMHRGRIEVTSQNGHGTTFTVWLPLA